MEKNTEQKKNFVVEVKKFLAIKKNLILVVSIAAALVVALALTITLILTSTNRKHTSICNQLEDAGFSIKALNDEEIEEDEDRYNALFAEFTRVSKCDFDGKIIYVITLDSKENAEQFEIWATVLSNYNAKRFGKVVVYGEGIDVDTLK